MWDADDEWSVGEARQVVDAFIRHCYPQELKLDEQKVNTYLETMVSTEGGKMSFRHWNKNYTHMLQHGRARIYKHQHPCSYAPEERMEGTLIGEFSRIVVNSDRGEEMRQSLWEKIWELVRPTN